MVSFSALSTSCLIPVTYIFTGTSVSWRFLGLFVVSFFSFFFRFVFSLCAVLLSCALFAGESLPHRVSWAPTAVGAVEYCNIKYCCIHIRATCQVYVPTAKNDNVKIATSSPHIALIFLGTVLVVFSFFILCR